jgi:phospholipid transport system substrate-binding protein
MAKGRLWAIALVASALSFAPVVHAGAATDVTKAKQTALFDLLKATTPDQKKIDAIYDEWLDYSTLSESSLGSEWAARTDAEKTEFSALLKQLVRNAYQKNLKKISSFTVTYTAEVPADGATLVKTKSTKPGSPDAVEIDFKVVQKNGKWKVVDIVTDGVSLVGSYRSQFTTIIKKDGFPALIQKMKDKLAKGE